LCAVKVTSSGLRVAEVSARAKVSESTATGSLFEQRNRPSRVASVPFSSLHLHAGRRL
jgi:hypothetical protein